ncbi:MAG: peptide chain release factor 1 [Cyanophyceae cyanobacterium]
MNDPWQRFKSQPWPPLLKAAALTTAVSIVLDSILAWGMSIESLRRSLTLVFTPPLGLILPLAAAVGVGALSVYVCERSQSVRLNVGSLWALVLCLMIGLLLKSLLPFPALLIGLSSTTAVGVIVGIFWKGRNHWR